MSTPRLPWDDDVPEPLSIVHPAPSAPVPSTPPASSTPVPAAAALAPPLRAPADAPVRAYLDGAAAARLDAVRRHVLDLGGHDVRVVAPTHEQAHDVVRTILAGQAASVGVERAGWVGLAMRLATPALIARGLVPISGLGFEAVVARAVARARTDGALRYFADTSRHPGFAPCLARTLAEVRLAAIAPRRLDDGTAKGHDLAYLAASIAQALVDLRHADRADILALAAEAAAAPDAARWSAPLALVDPPLASRLEVRLASALLRRSRHPLVVAPHGDPWIRRLLDDLGVTETDGSSQPPTPSALRRVQRDLFGSAAGDNPDVAAIQPMPGDESVTCLSAPGEGRECVELVRVLLGQAERGIPFDRMAIVTRAPELYASHLETALRRADVPACFGRGTRRPDQAGRAFLALLSCVVEDFSARRFAEYLSLGQVPSVLGAASSASAPGEAAPALMAATDDGSDGGTAMPDDPEALGLAADPEAGRTDADAGPAERRRPDWAPWRWEAILNDAQVISGAARWRSHLPGHRAQLELRAEGARKDDPTSARAEALARRATWTAHLVEFVHTFLVRPGDLDAAAEQGRWLEDWPVRDDWGGWLARLRALAPRVLAHPSRVLATLAELQPLSGIADVSLAEVVDVLHDRLTHLPVTPPPQRYGRVFVGTPEQVRGRAFDVVCVPGLAERVFPQRSRQDPLLLDRERLAISPDLVVDDDRVAAERLQLRLAVGAASQALVVSYASLETTQSRPRVPSFYAIDVQRAVSGRVPGYEALMREAQRRSGARLAWPAPQDPLAAIDPAEHDLSMLQRYLHGDDSDIAGRARYLFGLNPSLRRALVARHQRLSGTWGPHDGLLGGPGSLAAHRLAARTYSASALQRFATCPYQFYLSTILRLEPREEAAPLTTLDPLTRGSMVHEMLATIMRAFIAKGWTPPPAERLAEAQADADRLACEVAANTARRLLPPIRRVWDDAIDAIRRDLREWVRRLTKESDGWVPVHVEYGIGFPGGNGLDEASQAQPVVLPDGTQLHGVVDLIERQGTDQYRITDYKTGKYRLTERTVVNGGRTLQPILYAMAVEAAFAGRVTASRLYFCTEDGDFKEHDWGITGEAGEHARREGLNVLALVDRAIEFGHLPAAPADDACRWCDFTAVCGPGAQQVPSRKDGKAVADLAELRRWR